MVRTRYLSVDEIIEANRRVLGEIKVKKADSHRILDRKGLEELVVNVEKLDGDAYRKAVFMLVGLIRGHHFASGVRRTAFAVTEVFLQANGNSLNITYEPEVFTGIREHAYSEDEIEDWLKGNGIRRFSRS